MSGARWPLIALLGAAFALRVWGIGHGLPHVFEHDEIATVLAGLRHAGGDWAPAVDGYYHGILLTYLLAGIFGVLYLAGHVSGAYPDTAAFIVQLAVDPSRLYLAGRLAIAALGTLVVWTTFDGARRLAGRAAAWMAALFVSVSVLHVNMSKLIKEDMLAAALLGLGFLAVCRGAERIRQSQAGGVSSYAWAGWWVGLAVNAKYVAGPAVLWLPLLAAHERPRAWRHMAIGLAAAAAGFVATNPFVIGQLPKFIQDLWAYHSVYSTAVVPNPDGHSSAMLYLTRFLPVSLGWPVALAAGVSGAWLLLARRWLIAGLLLSFPAALLGWLMLHTAFPSFLTPAIPFVAIAAAFGVSRAIEAVRWPSTAGVLVAMAMASPAFMTSLRFNRYVTAQDTRSQAARWIEANIPAGSRVAVEGSLYEAIIFGPPLKPTRQVLEAELAVIRGRGGSGRLWEAALLASAGDQEPRYAICKVWVLTEEQLAACHPEYAVIVTDPQDASWSVNPDDRSGWLHSFAGRATLLAQFDAEPGVKFFPSHWALREESERLKRISLLGGHERLATGPRIRVFRLP